MFQSDADEELVEERMKSPFGSSIRTFDATDYKPIGESTKYLNTLSRGATDMIPPEVFMKNFHCIQQD